MSISSHSTSIHNQQIKIVHLAFSNSYIILLRTHIMDVFYGIYSWCHVIKTISLVHSMFLYYLVL